VLRDHDPIAPGTCANRTVVEPGWYEPSVPTVPTRFASRGHRCLAVPRRRGSRTASRWLLINGKTGDDARHKAPTSAGSLKVALIAPPHRMQWSDQNRTLPRARRPAGSKDIHGRSRPGLSTATMARPQHHATLTLRTLSPHCNVDRQYRAARCTELFSACPADLL
jgi:hypothetical protein